MERITISDAQRDLMSLVDHVYLHGVSMDLERDQTVIARICPVRPPSTIKVGELSAFLQQLPKLGDDTDAFSHDLREIRREFPSEGNSWD